MVKEMRQPDVNVSCIYVLQSYTFLNNQKASKVFSQKSESSDIPLASSSCSIFKADLRLQQQKYSGTCPSSPRNQGCSDTFFSVILSLGSAATTCEFHRQSTIASLSCVLYHTIMMKTCNSLLQRRHSIKSLKRGSNPSGSIKGLLTIC